LADLPWRVRRGCRASRFADGLVLHGGSAGRLALTVCRTFRSLKPMELGALAPLAAACASEGIRRDTGLMSWLHWPNLVTIEDRVVATTKTSVEPLEAKTNVTFAISVNCFGDGPESFPRDLPRSSIFEMLGVKIERGLLRDKILHALDWYCAELDRGMDRKLLDRIGPTIAWLGREIDVTTTSGETARGFAKGLDDQGCLVLGGLGGSRNARLFRPDRVALVRVR
jgi:biotin-(acetyl-CoA carboxylase) ligase